MAQPYRLPPRGASGAPSFEPDQPETLLDFFEDLEYMLEQADVSEDQKRKEHTVRYAPSTQKALWRGFDSYDVQNGKSYDEFKSEIVKEYLGEGGKRLYSIGDLKAIVQTYAAKGFQSSSEFKVYSRSFRVVADDLVMHNVMREDDRDRHFVKVLPEPLRAAVIDRLKYKCPDVLAPRVPYTVAQVTAAVEFVLDSQDEDAPIGSSTSTTVTAASISPQIKTESSQLADALTAMAQAVALLHQRGPSPNLQRQGPPHLDRFAPRPGQCIYCGGTDHSIRACPQVASDTSAGLVKHNEQGQVVLSTGNFVPSVIAGDTLRERVQEYYRQHPNVRDAPAVQHMLFEPVNLAATATSSCHYCNTITHPPGVSVVYSVITHCLVQLVGHHCIYL